MQDSDIRELERIWELKEKGAISDAEYSELKNRILTENSGTIKAESSDPQTHAPLAGTDVESRNNTYGSDVGKVLGIGGAAILVLVLILAAIGTGGSNSSTANTMNLDENLTTTDMNVTTLDINATGPKAADTSQQTQSSEEDVGRGYLTPAQANAARSAEQYLRMSGFSREGLIEQLSSSAGDGYSVADATAAVDSLTVDWNENAGRSARQYLNMSGFSCEGLIEQLSSRAGDKYTAAQARYGAREAGAC